jgi:hypothetical protein
VSGYDLAAWHGFAIATVGAAATLTGLIFVAISINLDRILEVERLPRRAAGTLALLLALLVVGLFLAAPGQGRSAVAVELGLTGLVLGCAAVFIATRATREVGEPLRWLAGPFVILLAPALALMAAAVSIGVGSGGGLYWVLGAVVVGFCGAVADAWVLLVEVKR